MNWFDSLFTVCFSKLKCKGEALVRNCLLTAINPCLMGYIIPYMPCLPPTQILCFCFKNYPTRFNCFYVLLKEVALMMPHLILLFQSCLLNSLDLLKTCLCSSALGDHQLCVCWICRYIWASVAMYVQWVGIRVVSCACIRYARVPVCMYSTCGFCVGLARMCLHLHIHMCTCTYDV